MSQASAAASKSLVEKDESEAQKVIENESRIDRMEIETDDVAIRLLTLGQPIPPVVRTITALIKINHKLAGMAHLEVTITEPAISWMHEPVVNAVMGIFHMANLVKSLIQNGLDSFRTMDEARAPSSMALEPAASQLRDEFCREFAASWPGGSL